MARSIREWFADRESGSLDEALDDEVVERQAPWDLAALRGAPPRASDGRRTPSRRVAVGVAKKTAKGRGRAPTTVPAVPPVPASAGSDPVVSRVLRERITVAIRLHPGLGARRVAAAMRAAGADVTKAQVALVLRDLAPPTGRASTAPAARAARAGAGSGGRRPAPLTPLCGSCGVAISHLGMCRCS
jgi:hypothetical protein